MEREYIIGAIAEVGIMIALRTARCAVQFIDEYCESYRDLFVEVRSFEAFKHLHVGAIAELPRKSLPAIA